MADNQREEIVIENTVCIEDVKFTILQDLGIIDLYIPKSSYIYNQFYTVPLHSHEYYELTYSLDELELIYEDESQVHEGGTLVVTPPGQKHAQRRNASFQGRGNYTLSLCMKKLPVTSDIPLYDILTKLFDNDYSYKCSKRALEIIASLDRDTKNSIANDKIAISLALHELISIIINTAGKKYVPKPTKKISDSNATRAYKIHMILSNFYKDDISVEYISEKLGLSARQVTRIIKSIYGKTFKDLLIEKRMNLAGRQLINTDKNISDIASDVGYNTSKGFYNAFKEYYGCLPSEYRKEHKK